MKTSKPKSDARDYMPWAGMFVRPDTDPEAFRSLPGWRQREINLGIEIAKTGRSMTLADLQKMHSEAQPSLIAEDIPMSWSLGTLKRLSRPLPEAATPSIGWLREYLPLDRTFEVCTVFGDGRILRPHRPAEGLFAYIWYLAAYRKKLIPVLPVSAYLELEEYLAQKVKMHVSVRHPSELADSLLTYLDRHVDQFVQSLA